jgi:hypothetical protein
MEQYIFATKINGTANTGIVNTKDMNILCLCSELNARLILSVFEKAKKLEFMVENGLGWEDMRNDIKMPNEL